MANARAMPRVKGNCDSDITLADKTAYDLARSDPEEYASQYPGCDILNGDVNGDDVLDEDDDDMFMALLSGGNSAMYVVYTWDAENRLIKVEPGGTPQDGQYKAEYKYDWQGRRVEKQVWNYSGGWTQTEDWKFMHADWLLLLELDGLDSDSVKRQYTWGLDLSGLMRNPVGQVSNLSPALTGAGGIGGLLSVHDNALSVSYVYFADVQGNTGQVVDLGAASASVSMMAKYQYDAYGNRTVTAATYTQPFGFSTKFYDSESGFAYFGRRHYMAQLGRLVNRADTHRAARESYVYSDNSLGNSTGLEGQVPSRASGPLAPAPPSGAPRPTTLFFPPWFPPLGGTTTKPTTQPGPSTQPTGPMRPDEGPGPYSGRSRPGDPKPDDGCVVDALGAGVIRGHT
jgi:RHS repeat-associated protein